MRYITVSTEVVEAVSASLRAARALLSGTPKFGSTSRRGKSCAPTLVVVVASTSEVIGRWTELAAEEPRCSWLARLARGLALDAAATHGLVYEDGVGHGQQVA
jgi:hypothetical protein